MKTKAEVLVYVKRKPFKKLLAVRNLSLANAAELLGVHRSYVNDLLSHRSSAGPKVRKKIMEAFQLEFSELFQKAGSRKKRK